MENGHESPHSSPIPASDTVATTPIASPISQLQHALQTLSQSGRGFAASSVDAGAILPRELIRSLNQQLRHDSESSTYSGTPQHVEQDQLAAILRSLSQLAQQSPGTALVAPSSDPSPASAVTSPHPPEESTAAAAERHRLASAQVFDLQAVARWLESLLPYILILAAIFVYHFCTGIFLSLWLLCSLVKANQLMRQVIAQQRDCQATEIAAALLYIGTNVGVVAWLTSGQKLYRSLMLKPPVLPLTVWQAVFLVLVADSLVRFCGLAPKLLVIATVQSRRRRSSSSDGGSSNHSHGKKLRRQASMLTLLEYLISGYRAVVPIPVWYTYLLTCTVNNLLCSLLAGFYLTFKGYALLQQGQLVYTAAKLVLRTGASYGRYLGKSEMAGACCPVCQEPATSPVKLDCSHVFCDECISEWLERDKDKTCPMCRASVTGAGLKSFGDGRTSLLPQLF